MLSLYNTTEVFVMETRRASTVDYIICYNDHTSTTILPNNTHGTVSTVANTTVLTAPAAGTQRQITAISVRNKGVLDTTVVLKVNVAVTSEYHVGSPFSLRSGESLFYSKHGFQVHQANGVPYQIQSVASPVPSIVEPPGQHLSALTGVKVIHASGYAYAGYLGKAPFSCDGLKIACNVVVIPVTPVWTEIAIAKGTPVLNGSPTLTVLGYTDVQTVMGTLGAKNVQVNITPPNYITESDDLWIVFGGAATTAMQYRATTVADNVGAGFFHSAFTRPSLNVGIAVQYTIDDVVIGTNTFPLLLVAYT